jgi:hypothetical protein
MADLGETRSGIFLPTPLDWANQVELLQQISFCAQDEFGLK